MTLTALTAGDASIDTTIVTVKIDKVDPLTTATVTPSLGTSTTATVSITATDQPTLSGLKKVYWKVGASAVASTTLPSVLAGGTFNVTGVAESPVQFWAEDVAGNVEDTRTVNVIIDKIAPTTTSNRVASYVNTATITFTPADTGGSGVKRTLLPVGRRHDQDRHLGHNDRDDAQPSRAQVLVRGQRR